MSRLAVDSPIHDLRHASDRLNAYRAGLAPEIRLNELPTGSEWNELLNTTQLAMAELAKHFFYLLKSFDLDITDLPGNTVSVQSTKGWEQTEAVVQWALANVQHLYVLNTGVTDKTVARPIKKRSYKSNKKGVLVYF
jgi:hypothetical protein